MKYICLGYIEPGKFEGMTEDERHRTFDICFEYNDHLRANGHLVAEVPLQPPETALTLYWKNGKPATTDEPYAETKEQVGGDGTPALRLDECAKHLGPASFEVAVSLESALQHILDSLLRFRPRQRCLKRSDGGEELVGGRQRGLVNQILRSGEGATVER